MDAKKKEDMDQKWKSVATYAVTQGDFKQKLVKDPIQVMKEFGLELYLFSMFMNVNVVFLHIVRQNLLLISTSVVQQKRKFPLWEEAHHQKKKKIMTKVTTQIILWNQKIANTS